MPCRVWRKGTRLIYNLGSIVPLKTVHRSSAQLVYDPDVIIDDIAIIPELDGRV